MTDPVPTPSLPGPPRARRIPHEVRFQGRQWTDEYFWLRERDDPRVRAHLESENAWTDQVMRPLESFQRQLYEEMLSRIKETDQDVPYREGAFDYYHRTEAGLEYPIFCRRALQPGSPEQVVLDLNELAVDQEYLGLGAYDPSPDGRLLAYSVDFTGFRDYTLFFKDIAASSLLPQTRDGVRSIAWSLDAGVLFYVTEDEAKRANRLWRHRLDVGGAPDEMLFEERDERFSLGVQLCRSHGYVILTSYSATTSETQVLPADTPLAAFSLLLERRAGVEYYVDHRPGLFYILTNDLGRNFRLVTAPTADPAQANWTELVPHSEEIMLEAADLFARKAVLHQRCGGLPQLRVLDLALGGEHLISLPEPTYAIGGDANAQFDTDTFRFRYESLVTPEAVFDYDLGTRERRCLKRQEVLGGYDPARYESARLEARAEDGTAIAVSLVWARALRTGGSQPMLLSGYGAYGFALDPEFSSTRLSLLDRGVVFAIAHVRGGGEMGKRWHEQGRLLAKRNTFSDFIGVAEHLIATGWTDAAQLVIEGGSAGGLLVGAVLNARPDLFRAAVAQVPFMDVVNTMIDSTLPLTTGEYEEWGNPAEATYFEYIRSYSPYDNLLARAYPALLVEASLNDSQVMYWEPAKYVARLRALKTDDHPLLLRTNLGAGHGGASGRYEYLREIAFTQAFILWQLGLVPALPGQTHEAVP